MKKLTPSTPLATLALIALALALFAGAASAAPDAPRNGAPAYDCSGGNWDRSTLEFYLDGSPNYRTGIVYKNGDNRKAALKLEGGVWEFTFVNDLQCKALFAWTDWRGVHRLAFRNCTDGINRRCSRR